LLAWPKRAAPVVAVLVVAPKPKELVDAGVPKPTDGLFPKRPPACEVPKPPNPVEVVVVAVEPKPAVEAPNRGLFCCCPKRPPLCEVAAPKKPPAPAIVWLAGAPKELLAAGVPNKLAPDWMPTPLRPAR
jgi:hypothetical protein